MIEPPPLRWRLKGLTLPCRVMGRGIESAFLPALVHRTADPGARIVQAELRDTGKNRMMRTMYQMMEFQPAGAPSENQPLVFRADPRNVPAEPSWIEMVWK